ncbi:VOC family protein [Pilimelia columellifera]|uniref:VOC family protein n=1 Tax=Pilimelia columellifera subsp. columellifera TaxID=706583 RepID=A0ABN3N2X3_9ACTN
MRISRVVPNLTVSTRDDLDEAVTRHSVVLGLRVLMDHGWIVTLGDGEGHQLSVMTRDASAPLNPDVSIFVDGVHEAYERAISAGVEVVHPVTEEAWGVTRFFYRDHTGRVINVGMHSMQGQAS